MDQSLDLTRSNLGSPEKEPKAREYPKISVDQYQAMLRMSSGKDGRIDFTGSVEYPDRTSFVSTLRIHDDFPELGSRSNLAINLRAASGRIDGTEPESIADFNGYVLGYDFGTPLDSKALPAGQEAAVVKAPQASAGPSQEFVDYQYFAGFYFKQDIANEAKLLVRERVGASMRLLLEHLIRSKPQTIEDFMKIGENFVRARVLELQSGTPVNNINFFHSNQWMTF